MEDCETTIRGLRGKLSSYIQLRWGSEVKLAYFSWL